VGKKILLEDTIGEFVVDRQSIAESTSPIVNGRSFLRMSGRLSLCDTLNGNNRIYPRKVWERQFQTGSRLMELIKRNRSVGLLEHPKDGQVSLNSPISHLLIDAKLLENGEVSGEILIINTPEGLKLRALVEAGFNPLVSSRGYGSLESVNGNDIVQEDYVCEGWDAVFHPSFKQCELEAATATESTSNRPTALRESAPPLQASPPSTSSTPSLAQASSTTVQGINMWCVYKALAEHDYKRDWSNLSEDERDALAKKASMLPKEELTKLEAEFNSKRAAKEAAAGSLSPVSVVVVRESKTISGQAQPKPGAVGAASSAPLTEKITMDAIRQKLNSIAAFDPRKQTPAQLTESRAQLRGLHNETAKWLAEDATRSYEAQQLHKAIEEVEATWDQAITQPRAESSRLLTERQKALSVLNAVVESTKKFQVQLTEAIQKNTKISAVNTKLMEAVRAWQDEAKRLEGLARLYESKYNLACQCLDDMGERWKSNTTELGQRVVELEIGEAQRANPAFKVDPDLTKKLAECQHPDDVADIREAIFPEKAHKEATAGKTGTVTEGATAATTAAATAAATATAAQPLNESKGATQTQAATMTALVQPKVASVVRSPGSLKSSIGIARRLFEDSHPDGKKLTEASTAAA
jgi:hypothetical protein